MSCCFLFTLIGSFALLIIIILSYFLRKQFINKKYEEFITKEYTYTDDYITSLYNKVKDELKDKTKE